MQTGPNYVDSSQPAAKHDAGLGCSDSIKRESTMLANKSCPVFSTQPTITPQIMTQVGNKTMGKSVLFLIPKFSIKLELHGHRKHAL